MEKEERYRGTKAESIKKLIPRKAYACTDPLPSEPLQYQSDEKLSQMLQELLNASEPYLKRQKGTKRSDCKKLNMAYEKARQTLEEFEDQKNKKKKETNEHGKSCNFRHQRRRSPVIGVERDRGHKAQTSSPAKE